MSGEVSDQPVKTEVQTRDCLRIGWLPIQYVRQEPHKLTDQEFLRTPSRSSTTHGVSSFCG